MAVELRLHNSGHMPTTEESLDWVEAVCLAVITWHEPAGADLSILDMFERTSADLSDRTRFQTLVSEWLRTRPDLVKKWSMFSDDTRATPWPYFSIDRLEVGFVSVKGKFEDMQQWANGWDACADYLFRAFTWVLCRER